MIQHIARFLFLAVIFLAATPVLAQQDSDISSGLEDLANSAQRANSETLNLEPSSDENTAALGQEEDPEALSEQSYIYEVPTVAKLSQLYWALGRFQKDDDKMIDNYLFINECDLYKDYYHNEFEWAKIREAGKSFIMKNKRHFPVRFSYVQPLYLADYDIDRQVFSIQKDYAIQGIRIFEVQALDLYGEICGQQDKEIAGYPRALTIEVSRPLELTEFPIGPSAAKAFILEKMDAFKNLPEKAQTQENLYLTRDAYILVKLKIYAIRGESRSERGYWTANVLGVLEGYEVYSDKELQNLLFEENLMNRKKVTAREEELKRQYQQRLQQK